MNESHDINQLDKKYAEEAPSAEFAALLDQDASRSCRELSVGERGIGKIQKIEGTHAFVDYGGRSEAVIDIQELRNDMGELLYTPGDTIEAYVASVEGEVRFTLSLRAGSFEILRQAYQNGVPVDGRVTGFNSGGLVVNLGGKRAFCPTSQIDTGYCEDLASYASQTLTFKIVELRKNNIVLSRRAYLEAEAARRAQELRARLSKGAEMDGKVTRVERFGAFVDLGGVEGLIHVSELQHSRVGHPRDVISTGDEVRVKILELKGLGGDKERISLSIKALQPDPWDDALDRFREGDIVTGKVVSIQQFGAFVELLPGVEGLVHISQLATNRVSRPGEVVSVGQEVQALIQKVDRDQKRISLSIKALQQQAKQTAETQEIKNFQAKQEKAPEDRGGPMADALRRAGLI
jgi:small subunit ribosomal protein S1